MRDIWLLRACESQGGLSFSRLDTRRTGPRAHGRPAVGSVGGIPRPVGADRERREWTFEWAHHRVHVLRHREVRVFLVCQ